MAGVMSDSPQYDTAERLTPHSGEIDSAQYHKCGETDSPQNDNPGKFEWLGEILTEIENILTHGSVPRQVRMGVENVP